MSNIKVSLQKALAPGRDKFKQPKLMKVMSVTASGNKFKHSLVGDNSKMTKILDQRYAAGSQLVVSDGEVVGKTKAIEHEFFV